MMNMNPARREIAAHRFISQLSDNEESPVIAPAVTRHEALTISQAGIFSSRRRLVASRGCEGKSLDGEIFMQPQKVFEVIERTVLSLCQALVVRTTPDGYKRYEVN
jgi:hypothetical protein